MDEDPANIYIIMKSYKRDESISQFTRQVIGNVYLLSSNNP